MSVSEYEHVDLQKSLRLEEVAKDAFQSTEKLHVPLLARGVFGGTLVAQALYAAILTIPYDFVPHSLHSYFVEGAKGNIPITYKVGRIRDGKSFILREIRAYQNDVLVFIENVSFTLRKSARKGNAPPQLESSKPTPKIIRFQDCVPPKVAFETAASKGTATGIVSPKNQIAKQLYFDDFEKGPSEYRFPLDFYESAKDSHHRDFGKESHEINTDLFVRVHHKVHTDYRFHYVAFAYYSDSYILIATMKNHKRPMHSAVFSVSLDHVIYFHKEFDSNAWLLFHVEHPRALDSRLLAYGEVYDNEEIVASVIQEGLVVVNDEKLAKRSKL